MTIAAGDNRPRNMDGYAELSTGNKKEGKGEAISWHSH